MARLAYRFAMSSPRVTAESIEANAFPQLASRHQVRAVPHTVVNGRENVIGAVPEAMLLKAVEKVVGSPPS
jgi:predicted DsbA family dithiol-disulfide isomerase